MLHPDLKASTAQLLLQGSLPSAFRAHCIHLSRNLTRKGPLSFLSLTVSSTVLSASPSSSAIGLARLGRVSASNTPLEYSCCAPYVTLGWAIIFPSTGCSNIRSITCRTAQHSLPTTHLLLLSRTCRCCQRSGKPRGHLTHQFITKCINTATNQVPVVPTPPRVTHSAHHGRTVFRTMC